MLVAEATQLTVPINVLASSFIASLFRPGFSAMQVREISLPYSLPRYVLYNLLAEKPRLYSRQDSAISIKFYGQLNLKDGRAS